MTQSMLRRLQCAKFLGFWRDANAFNERCSKGPHMTQSMLRRLQCAKFLGFWRDANAFNDEYDYDYDPDDIIVFHWPWG